MSTKAELREQAIFHRDRIKPEDEDVEAASALFFDHVDAAGKVVAVYWPMGKEFDSRYLIQDLLKKNIAVVLPVASKATREMAFAPWDGKAELVKGDFGIMVPDTQERAEPDILVVPFLAFDRRGHRLGRGAGHYDATIGALRARRKILAIGLGYAGQAVLFNLPAEEHDAPLDLVITPSGVHDFRK
jgi:5-formyltetrahydrofolate cyclo-ligase